MIRSSAVIPNSTALEYKVLYASDEFSGYCLSLFQTLLQNEVHPHYFKEVCHAAVWAVCSRMSTSERRQTHEPQKIVSSLTYLAPLCKACFLSCRLSWSRSSSNLSTCTEKKHKNMNQMICILKDSALKWSKLKEPVSRTLFPLLLLCRKWGTTNKERHLSITNPPCVVSRLKQELYWLSCQGNLATLKSYSNTPSREEYQHSHVVD